jgi:hypothetical protein
MIGKHGDNWMGPTKARKDINLYFGFMFYINGLGASLWLAQAVWLSYKDATYAPHCISSNLPNEMSVDFCLGSWKYYITGHKENIGVPDRINEKQFAFLKIAAPVTLCMAIMFMLVRWYWLIAEEGRVSNFATEYKDKMLPTMEEETAEKKNIQNIRADRIAYITRAILEFPGDKWYFGRFFWANFLTGIIIVAQLAFLHFALGNTLFRHSAHNNTKHKKSLYTVRINISLHYIN